MTADAIIRIKIDANTGEARVIKRDLDDLGKSGDRVASSSDKMRRSFGLLRGALIALGGALSIQQFSRLADTITNINTKLGNVTDTAQEFNTAFNDLFDVAQRTGTAFTATVDTFNRLNTALPESISQTRDLTKTVELLQKGFAASGTEAAAARGAITQLTQGLASNFQASAQEINSLIDAAPLLAKVIAEQLGGNAATDLKRFAEAGTLTAESFLDALEAAEDSISAFEIPPTIERAVTRLRNEFLLLASNSSTLEAAGQKLAGAINGIADNLNNLSKALGVLAGALAAVSINAFISSLTVAIGSVGGLTAAIQGLTAALAGSAALTGALGAVAAAGIIFKDELTASIIAILIEIQNQIDNVINKFKNLATISGSGLTAVFLELQKNLKIISEDEFNTRLLALAEKQDRTFASRSASQESQRVLRNDIRDRAIFDLVNGNSDFDATQNLPTAVNIPKVRVNETQEAVKELSQEVDSLNKNEITDTQDAFSDLTVQIERDFARAFKSAFTESGNGFEGFVDGLKSTFQNFIAEIAFQASKPIFLNLVAGAAGGIGLTGLSSSPAFAALGGGGSGGGFLGGGSLLTGSGFSPFLGNIGGKIGNLFAGGGIGPSTAGFIGSQAFGNLGFGALGSFGASALGLGGGLGGTIGGTLGSLAGGGIGASVGSILGLAGGPAGAVIGGFLGTALGGLFGGDQQFPFARANITTDRETGLVKLQSTEELDDGDRQSIERLGQSVADAANLFVQSIGASGISNRPETKLGTASGRSDLLGSGFFAGGAGSFQGGADFTNISSAERAAELAVRDLLLSADFGGLSSEINTVVQQSLLLRDNLDDTIADVQLARTILETDETVGPLQVALDALNDQFDEMRRRASELGLPLENVNALYERQKEALIGGALQPLQDFLDSQALSGESSLSAVDRLGIARSVFDENLSSISSGDFSGLNDLTSQASQLLSVGRDVFASGEGFNALEAFVRQSVAGVAGDLGAEGALNDSITRDIAISNAEQTSILQQVNAEIQQLREENRKLRKSMERVGNAVVTLTS